MSAKEKTEPLSIILWFIVAIVAAFVLVILAGLVAGYLSPIAN